MLRLSKSTFLRANCGWRNRSNVTTGRTLTSKRHTTAVGCTKKSSICWWHVLCTCSCHSHLSLSTTPHNSFCRIFHSSRLIFLKVTDVGLLISFFLRFIASHHQSIMYKHFWKLFWKVSKGVANVENLFKEMKLIKMHPLDLFLNGCRTLTDGNTAALASSYSKQKASLEIERISSGF